MWVSVNFERIVRLLFETDGDCQGLFRQAVAVLLGLIIQAFIMVFCKWYRNNEFWFLRRPVWFDAPLFLWVEHFPFEDIWEASDRWSVLL